MQAFEVPELLGRQRAPGHTYVDFLRTQTLSLGLSIWPAGLPDEQRPHAEDEVYYVVAGSGVISVAGEDRQVRAGSLVFVGAGVEHRFHSIEADLEVLVFWSPPHGAAQ